MLRHVVGGAVLCAMVIASPAGSAAFEGQSQWPVWRGPMNSGVSPDGDPPLEWSETKNVAWKIEIPGRGSGTPVVWGDRVYVLPAVGAPDATADSARARRGSPSPTAPLRFNIMAINRADGSVAWERTAREELPHEARQINNSFASASAMTDGEHVWAYFGSRGIYCYDMDGNLVWEKDLGDMSTRREFGEGNSPALHGDTLVITWDHEGPSYIVALDKRSGEEMWRTARDEITTWGTPLILEHAGRTQVITAGTNRVRSYDFSNGELIWDGPGLTLNSIPSPVYADGVVYLMAGYRGSALRAVRLDAAAGDIGDTAAVVWQADRDTPYVPSPLLYEDVLYVLKSNDPILTVYTASTGERRYGPQRLEGLREVYASPVGAAGRVYLIGRDGGGLVLDNGPAFEVLAQNSLDDGFDGSPAIVGNEMYLRGNRYLYRISLD